MKFKESRVFSSLKDSPDIHLAMIMCALPSINEKQLIFSQLMNKHIKNVKNPSICTTQRPVVLQIINVSHASFETLAKIQGKSVCELGMLRTLERLFELQVSKPAISAGICNVWGFEE